MLVLNSELNMFLVVLNVPIKHTSAVSAKGLILFSELFSELAWN